MCVILFAYKAHPRYPLILAANRDEFFSRPASPAGFWEEHPHVLAGKDMEKGGTWLGISGGGYLAALTNYRDLRIPSNPEAVSRGNLVLDYLVSPGSSLSYLRKINQSRAKYNNFNLLLGKFDDLFFYSSVNGNISPATPGIHGLSNALPDTPWPKVKKGKAKLLALIEKKERDIRPERLMSVLKDSIPVFDDKELPDTGIGLETERMLSPIFIKNQSYGTRVSSVIIMDARGRTIFAETTFAPGGKELLKKKYELNIRD